ncbi:MAG: hypothetical protein Kow00120_21150 [Anaerolineae bacterium]
MKRRSLVRHFIGEPTHDDPMERYGAGYDRVDLEIHGGKVSFIVPHDIPDDAVYESGWLERFVGCDVDLGEGYVLHITISGDCHGVDARIERTKEA